MSVVTFTTARGRGRLPDARARVLERRDIREAVQVTIPIAVVIVGATLLLFAERLPARVLLGIGVVVALAAIWWLARGRLRSRPHICAFVLCVVMLVGRVLPVGMGLASADLLEAYFGLIVVGSSAFLPWSSRWHAAWLAVAGATYVVAITTLPQMQPAETRELVFLATALLASVAGSMIVRARRHRQHAAHLALRAHRAALQAAHAKLREVAQRDPLTGLLNRRRLTEEIAMLEARLARGTTDMAVLMVDLDSFKAYNDAFGHHAGDQVLRACSAATRASVRAVDHVFRYGGEELLVLLDGEDRDGARIAAARIVEAIRALRIRHPGSATGFMTVSVGSAALNARAIGPWQVIDEADRALYAAKAAGRDRAESWWGRSTRAPRKPVMAPSVEALAASAA